MGRGTSKTSPMDVEDMPPCGTGFGNPTSSTGTGNTMPSDVEDRLPSSSDDGSNCSGTDICVPEKKH